MLLIPPREHANIGIADMIIPWMGDRCRLHYCLTVVQRTVPISSSASDEIRFLIVFILFIFFLNIYFFDPILLGCG